LKSAFSRSSNPSGAVGGNFVVELLERLIDFPFKEKLGFS